MKISWVTSTKSNSIGKFRGGGYFSIDSKAAADAMLKAGAVNPETNKASGKVSLGGGFVKVWPLSKAIQRREKFNPGKRERNSAATFTINRL